MSQHSFLPSFGLRRQPAVRSRAGTTSPPRSRLAASTKSRPIHVLPRLSEEEEETDMPSSSFVPPSPRIRSSKRFSRYGVAEFSIPNDTTFLNPRPAPLAPQEENDFVEVESPISFASQVISPRPTRPASIVSLSGFDMTFGDEIDVPAASPTPSMGSNVTSSSGSVPSTPTTSDDEHMLHTSPIKPQRLTIRPLAICKLTPELHSPSGSPIHSFEFTIDTCEADSEPEPEPEFESPVDESEDAAEWYTREFSSLLTVNVPRTPHASAARPDSLPPPPRASRASMSRQHIKPLPPLPCSPRSPCPSTQLDPTFPRRAHYIPAYPPPPVPTHPRTAPSGHATSPVPSTPSPPPMKKALTITVPPRRPSPPSVPVPTDISDILDDIAAWEFHSPASPSLSAPLSPPRVPETPSSAFPSPVEQPLPVLATPEPSPRSSCDSSVSAADSGVSAWEEDDDVEPVLRSRWSSSTLSSLAAERTPASASSRLLKFGLSGIRRARKSRPSEDASAPARKVTPRRSMDSTASETSAASSTSSGLRRKPIPIEIFMRQ